ncbi:hypothetical protein [Dyella sp.]|uniref:hypothetical protein n=1 Tax=Dyella sp. TaxID=1869338 RepID=UPI002FD96485
MKGQKSGGRKKGTPNKATTEREKAVAASGLTPLDYMLKTMRNSKLPAAIRLDAAHKAAPYVHPKLASVEHKGAVGTMDVGDTLTKEQQESIAREMLRGVGYEFDE